MIYISSSMRYKYIIMNKNKRTNMYSYVMLLESLNNNDMIIFARLLFRNDR